MKIGIDLGGSKTEILVLSDSGEELWRERKDTPRGNYLSILETIVELVDRACEKPAVPESVNIGIGIPGAVSSVSGKIKNANTTELIGQDLALDLEKRLKRKVRLENDANCLALSEAVDGAGEKYGTVFAVILGTGTGGGISFGRYIHRGPNSIAGEWGHNPFPYLRNEDFPGRPCYCGKTDCVETYISGPGMSLTFEKKYGKKRSAIEIAERAAMGEPESQSVLELYADQLARALSVVMNVLDPDVIVLGGGVSNIPALYKLVPRLWGQYVFSDAVETPLVKSVHGDSSGVRGAAWLWQGSIF